MGLAIVLVFWRIRAGLCWVGGDRGGGVNIRVCVCSQHGACTRMRPLRVLSNAWFVRSGAVLRNVASQPESGCQSSVCFAVEVGRC